METRKIYEFAKLQTQGDAQWPYSCALQTNLLDVRPTNLCCSNPTGLLTLTVLIFLFVRDGIYSVADYNSTRMGVGVVVVVVVYFFTGPGPLVLDTTSTRVHQS